MTNDDFKLLTKNVAEIIRVVEDKANCQNTDDYGRFALITYAQGFKTAADFFVKRARLQTEVDEKLFPLTAIRYALTRETMS